VMQDETVWLTQKEMAELFQRDQSVISRHVQNIFKEGELEPASTVAKIATVQQEGSRIISRDVEYYNLDVIISVGYRVKSHRGTQFHIWATGALREYLVKGFVWSGKVVSAKEARIAKNYLEELELKRLNLLVEQFLAYAELQAVEQRPMYMQQWVNKLDDFLRFNEKAVLQGKGLTR
jgi:hypothetical protein